MTVALKEFSWQRMVDAVEAVRERAIRASQALLDEGVRHSIIGGHAVAAWVARVDAEAVRNTKDVDLLIRRDDLPTVVATLEAVGFVHQQVAGVDMFLDGPDGSVRSAIHIVFAGERVRADYLAPTPDVDESEPGPDFPVPTLEALVRMKLTSFRLKDQVHLLDLIEVGLVDESWLTQVPPALTGRLQEVFEQRASEA